MPQKIAGREQRTLCVRNLGKSFHNQWIFRHVDHEFHSGEPYVLDNPSGSGKTTFSGVCADWSGRRREKCRKWMLLPCNSRRIVCVKTVVP